jgi:hypothetical protein
LDQAPTLTDRRAITWQACDALSAAGQKPSIGLVRTWTLENTGAHRGSAGDVQADIAAWYDMVFRLRHEKPITKIPDAIADAMRDLWTAALSAADDTLTSEREKIAAEKVEMEQLVDRARADAAAAVEVANSAKSEVQVAQTIIAGRDETIKRLEGSLVEMRVTLGAKDERIAGLVADLATKEAERTSSAAEMEGLRRATLLQVDQARSDARAWKVEYDRLLAEHKASASAHGITVSRLENDLASARGRMSAVEESLTEVRQRSVELEAQLSASKARELATAALIGPRKRLSTATGVHGRARSVPRRKL